MNLQKDLAGEILNPDTKVAISVMLNTLSIKLDLVITTLDKIEATLSVHDQWINRRTPQCDKHYETLGALSTIVAAHQTYIDQQVGARRAVIAWAAMLAGAVGTVVSAVVTYLIKKFG